VTDRAILRRTEGLAPQSVTRATRADGAIILTSDIALGPVVRVTADWLRRWAAEAPSRVALAERSGPGWREVSYGELLPTVQAIAAALVARGIGPGRNVAALSGNGIDHALLSLACQYVGAPFAPMAEQYSLIPGAHGRLRHVLDMMEPALVYVADAVQYSDALAIAAAPGREVVATRPAAGATPFADLLRGGDGAAAEAAHGLVGPDTLAKVLFTSGSSSAPKGVRTTQGMMCVNQTQLADCLPFLRTHPPRVLDWLPWNHVFGGSHNFNMMLANGGGFYIDDGKPTPTGFKRSLENLSMRPGTLSFNVPVAFAMLVDELRRNQDLKQRYFAELDLIFYAGATLPQEVWEGLEDFAMEICGAAPLMCSSWGMTETAPAVLLVHEPIDRAAVIGAPVPGVQIKLIPDDAMRCEIRVKGPNVMPGYFKNEAKTAESFDDEGFLITGDAVRFVDEGNPSAGLTFDGRISEDFKLLTGTWVHAGKLRGAAHAGLAPLAQDLVICGANRGEVGVLIFAVDPMGATSDGGALVGAALADAVRARLAAMAAHATGSSTRVARALVLAEAPSVEGQEITAKGNLNPARVQTRRADLVARLYDDSDPATVRI
jgi:feruloyl-CoA synthase